MLDQNYIDTAHLLRRAGFGATPDEIRAAASQGLDATTTALLHPECIPDTIDDGAIVTRLTALLPETKNGGMPIQAVRMWWVYRMVASPHPLVEKMTLFWHGHFTSKDGAQQGDYMLRQNQMFRQNALGNFRTLTLAVSRDPEMLRYLNGNQNYKAHPNENYGRELMELFTCGIGHYTEDDVKAAARAFSGWNIRQGNFYFNANQHDDGLKTFLGKTGNWNGDDIVDILVAHPATAHRLCTQLFSCFAYPDPEPEVLETMVKTYYSSGYDIRTVLDQMFRSRAFYSDKARYAVIKSPAQYVIGAVRMLGLQQTLDIPPAEITPENDMAANPSANPAAAKSLNPAQQARGRRLGVLAGLPTAMRSMGQDLLAPPSVKGWDGGENWINTSTLLSRINFANQVSQSRQLFSGQFARATDFLQQNNLTPEGWVDYLAQTLGPLPLTPATRQTLIDYVNTPDNSSNQPPPTVQNVQFGTTLPPRRRRGNPALENGMEGRLRGVIPLIMATPEFQVC